MSDETIMNVQFKGSKEELIMLYTYALSRIHGCIGMEWERGA